MKRTKSAESTPAPSSGTPRLDDATALAWIRDMDTPELMARAHALRLRLHGLNTHMVHSLNINPTNVCENKCELCAFWRERDNESAYVMSLDAVRERLMQARDMQLTDLHVVGGVIPELGLDYYANLFRMAKDILPSVLIQGLTAVEIQYLADTGKTTVEHVLSTLKAAGLDAIPGGGAEILEEKVRERICSHKISAETWLKIHEKAHALGMPTNATMLFGHYETPEDWIRHLRRLRDLQDRTHGFCAFILLPFHPSGTRLEVNACPSGHRIVRLAALSRLYLDNIPHLRVLANYMDRKLLEVLTSSGVDDIGGTSIEERIARAAGAPDKHGFGSIEEMRKLVIRLGFTPILVNSAYQPVGVTTTDTPLQTGSESSPAKLLAKASCRERVNAEEALRLYREAPFQELGIAANACRKHDVPGNLATYVVDRNLSITNVCEAGCRFCAFHVAPGSAGAFTLTVDQIVKAAREAENAGATQLMIQGGLNPDLTLAFYEDALRRLKTETGLWLHSLSPAEITYMAKRASLPMPEVLKRLRGAGLDSLPGGGAEILVESVRQRVSPHKISADDWFAVMRAAHDIGLKTTATMVYGLGESPAQRIEHLLRVREHQDKTGGFTAFIPWSFQPNRTRIDLPGETGVEYLRMVALSRIVLDSVRHIQAGWVTEGPDVAQLALSFGADDFGGVLMEEQVVRSTGVTYSVTEKDVTRLICEAGLTPAKRTTQYAIL